MSVLEEEQLKISIEERVARITVNRARQMNTLTPDVLQALLLGVERILGNPDVRAIVVAGAGGRAFVAGADVASMVDLGPRAGVEFAELGQRAFRALERAPVPVIAEVRGFALGGGLELAMACDVIIASTKAKVGLPEVKLGIIPGFGGTQRLAHRCGIGVARRLIYTGEMLSAEEAHRLGIVDILAEPEGLSDAVTGFCEQLFAVAPLAVRKAKELLRQTQLDPYVGGFRRETEAFMELFHSDDRLEGMQAFLQKREPEYKGR